MSLHTLQTMLTMVFLATSLLLVGVAVPMALGKVPPNGIYGFRTPRTLSDPKIWYAANRLSGRAMIVAGCASFLGTLVLAIFRDDLPILAFVIAHGVLVVGSVLSAAAYGLIKLRAM